MRKQQLTGQQQMSARLRMSEQGQLKLQHQYYQLGARLPACQPVALYQVHTLHQHRSSRRHSSARC